MIVPKLSIAEKLYLTEVLSSFNSVKFLDVSMHLYERVGPSVGHSFLSMTELNNFVTKILQGWVSFVVCPQI